MRIFLPVFICLLAAPLFAQKNKVDEDYKRNDFALALGMQGRKATFSAIYARATSPYKSFIFNLDITEIKSEKERRQTNSAFSTPGSNPSSYIFGKRNNLYIARIGFGQKIYVSERSNTQGITVALTYQGGLTVGFLKPYYLQLIYRTDSTYYTAIEPYSAENQAVFLNSNNIIGAGGFRLGWDAVQIRPAAFFKSSIWLEMGADASILGALEFGAVVDAFPRSVPILALTNASPVMFHIYANFHFGGRW